MLKQVAQGCVDRIDSLELTGVRADNEAIAYFAGAATALHLAKHDAAGQVATVLGLVLIVRGMREIRRIASAE